MDPATLPPGRLTPAPSRPGSRAAGPDRSAPRVSIVIPTYNEVANVGVLLDRIDRALTGERGLRWEAIVVDDDSPDGTADLVEERAGRDDRVRVLRRRGQRGLSSAVLTGMGVARGQVLVVIDADLQHDETKIVDLVAAVEAGADVCLGTREADGGGYGTFGRRRRLVSRLGATVARWVVGVPVSDPMSGFFAVSADRHRQLSGQLNPRGFKILLEFLARGPAPTVAEVGYVFGQRLAGTTKLTGPVIGAYLVGVVELGLARRRSRPRGAGRRRSEAVNRTRR